MWAEGQEARLVAPQLPLPVALQALAHPAARLVLAARVVVPAARPVVPPRAAAARSRQLAEASRYSG